MEIRLGYPLNQAPSHLRHFASEHGIKRGFFCKFNTATYLERKQGDPETIIAEIWSPSGKKVVQYKVKDFIKWIEEE